MRVAASTGTNVNSRIRQEELGQFLTPSPVAEFMASMFSPFPETVRLLDAGAGAGALTLALITRLCVPGQGVRAIEATSYEIDPQILPRLSATMEECRRLCEKAGIAFTCFLHHTDFIQDITGRLSDDLFGNSPPAFDAAIANPPYRKITANSPERCALRRVGIETSNLYTGFIALIHRLLAPGGQLVGITPRSFCNGPYFRLFRQDFLKRMELRWIHVFESRQAAFRDESVLQENIIFHAVRGKEQPAKMIVSSSSGEQGDVVSENRVPFFEVIHPNDPESFIHIPSNAAHHEAKEMMEGLTASLSSLGITVSTGRVVDFRLKDALHKEPSEGTVPLLYPCHFDGGIIRWPKAGSRKPNAIEDNEKTRASLIPSGIYLLTKRFTSKEERRRVVACVLEPGLIDADWIGIENNLNYFHSNRRGLERDVALGLYAYLNSTIVDQYFRRFSGHTQVNATDLRTLPYPDRETLESIGCAMNKINLPQDEIDHLVTAHLHACR